jgi:hypothetical protein
MTICGYNERIGEGLRILVEGMVQALEEKLNYASVSEVMDNEIIELETMIETMRATHGETLPEMFVGLNLLAKPLFERVRSNLRESKSENLGVECRAIGEMFVNILADTERRSIEQRLRKSKKASPDNLARELAQWVLLECKDREKALALRS